MTHGGHRRILARSLNQQLQRRKRAMRQKTTQNCIAMGIFRRIENGEELKESIQDWQLKVDMDIAIDSLGGLMKAVCIAPDLIFLGTLIPPVEQIHLIHYLSKKQGHAAYSYIGRRGIYQTSPWSNRACR